MYKLQCLALVCVLGPACGTDNRLEYFFTNAVLIAKEQPAANTSRDSRPAVCYGERYPDLYEAFCRNRTGDGTDGCEAAAARNDLHRHWVRHQSAEPRRRWGCGPKRPSCCTSPVACSACMMRPDRPPLSRNETRHPFRVGVCFWGVHLCARTPACGRCFPHHRVDTACA